MYAALEVESSRFYMCNFSPQNFGHTEYFEMKVSNVHDIVSQSYLNKTLQTMECYVDNDCVYGDICQSSCNTETRRCSGISNLYIPDVVKLCKILQEYLLYNIPANLKQIVSEHIADCIRIEKKSHTKSPGLLVVDEIFAIERLNKDLWDELKYSDMKFLERPTKKPYVT